jgi:hypothetical protein
MAGISAASASKTTTGSSVAYAASGWIRQERITLGTFPVASSSYVWELTNPNGSSSAKAYLSSKTSSSPNFVPDVGGTYVVTCVVDGSSSYSATMSVLDTAVSEPVEALRFTPRADAQVAAPSLGRATYYSSNEAALVEKDPSGTVRKYLLQAAAGAEYGELYWSSAALTALDVDTWKKAAGTTTLGLANEFTMPANNRLQHDDADTEVYAVHFDFSITCAGNSKTVSVGISKNGAAPDTKTRRTRLIATGANVGMGSTHGLFSLATGDYVEAWVKSADGTDVTIESGLLSAVKVV